MFHDAPVLRIKGPLFSGYGYLISDPAALWKIYDPNSAFCRPPSMKAIGEKILGAGGIILAEGDAHYRIKRIMQPGFTANRVKNFFPRFRSGSQALVFAWREAAGTKGSAVVDVFDWLGASSLDMIGLAAFGRSLGAVAKMSSGSVSCLDSESFYSDLAEVYKSLLDAMGGEETAGAVLLRYAPSWLMSMVTFALRVSPIKNELLSKADEALVSAQAAAAALIAERKKTLQLLTDEEDDLLSLILKANADSEAKLQLTDSELVAQIITLFFAGHGSSAAFLSWALYHLAQDIPLQDRLREEVMAQAVRFEDAEERRDLSIFSETEMPLFDAFFKEIMRYYPVVHNNERMSTKEETILPLSKPMTLTTGVTVNQISIPKGTIIYADMVSYNFDKMIWGDDAEEFNIDRWLKMGEKQQASKKFAPSVYAGLFNFIAGVKTCLGWRFLLLESQVFVFDLIRHFKFYPDPSGKDIRKRMQMVMVPVTEKDGEVVLKMPLRLEPIVD
ncbi:hypothetical protein VKT23_009314 [Stygiomarasmius scandens]